MLTATVPQDNILIDHDGQSRIADFGLSQLVTEVNHTNITSTVGSIRWMSKELFDHGIEDPCVSFESDIWAYGMTVLVSTPISYEDFR